MTLSSDVIRSTSLEVLAALGVSEVEMEVSIMELDHLIELARGGEVVAIDTSDPAGGFGGVDLWVATVVPALAAAMELRRGGALTVPALEEVVDDVLARVGSPRAREERERLLGAVRRAVGIAASR